VLLLFKGMEEKNILKLLPNKWIKDLRGMKFGKLTVIDFSEIKNHRSYWLCKCDCGTLKNIKSDCLVSKTTKTCGCGKIDIAKNMSIGNIKHNMAHTKFYDIWGGIKKRCFNKKTKYYKRYGGRGIKVCDRWLKFENFRDDMYKSYLEHVKEYGEKNTSIDRINNNGNYCLENCKWATYEEQNNNRRDNRRLTYNEQIKTLAMWSKKFKISSTTLSQRLQMGWTIHDALTKSIKNK